ncbi:MAG: multicopper oxidase domain-containing protein [Thermomicrobiales bacterium]
MDTTPASATQPASRPRSRRSTLTRRALIAGGVGLGGCVMLGGAITIPAALGPDTQSNLGELDFANPLAIPPLADSSRDPSGRRVFDLTLQTSETDVSGKGTATTWGINGPFLAPTLRAARGETVMMTIRNTLPEATSIHWHGMHLPAVMDGGPHQMIAPGDAWEPSWTVEQPASTLWYHPHPHGQTALHVYRGIAGLFLIDDDEAAALDLPSDYGVDDIPLIIQDKRMKGDGSFDTNPASFLDSLRGAGSFGILGSTILVNGTWNPHVVLRRRTRFRILNGSNARFYNLGFTDDRPFQLVASGNGLLPAPVEMTRLLIGPGERAEIVVDPPANAELTLRSYPQDLNAPRPIRRQIGADDTFDILRMRTDAVEAPAALPGRLGKDRMPALPEGVTERSFTLDGHNAIDGQQMDMSRIDLAIPAGALEVWTVRSNGQPHTFHVHGATFHVLDVDGERPPVPMRGPKDTVPILPNRPVRLAVQFGAHVDPQMPYMYHCHLLRHEDNGMMGQFVVVEPGTEAITPMTMETPAGHGHDHGNGS